MQKSYRELNKSGIYRLKCSECNNIFKGKVGEILELDVKNITDIFHYKRGFQIFKSLS